MGIMKKLFLLLLGLSYLGGWSTPAKAEFTLMAGLIQPLVFEGGNVAVEYKTDTLTFEYSHGWNLNYNAKGDLGLTQEEKDQELEIFQPYTTGFGIGYFMTDMIDIRVELKEHRYEVNPPADKRFAYATTSVGLGVFHSYYFNRGSDGWQLNSSLRYWPNVYSSLKNDEHTFLDKDGNEQTHKAHDLGVFANVSLGYTF